MRPYGTGGTYGDCLNEDDGASRVRVSYLGDDERLSRLKRRYDPTHLFRIDLNVPPAPDGSSAS